MASTKLHADADLIEAIAQRVAELLGGGASSFGLVDAATIARELGVERDWVYDHAEQLGGVRLGGPRGRLRFDVRVVRERLGGAEPSAWRPPRRPPRRSSGRKKPRRPPTNTVKFGSATAKAAGARANAPGLTPGGPPMQPQDNYARAKRA